MNDRELARRRHRCGRPVGHAHRWDAQFVTQRQARVGACPTLVDAHLAGADHAVHMGLGNALEQLDQIVVQTLPVPTLVDLHTLHGGWHGFGDGRSASGARDHHNPLAPGRPDDRFGPYNALHHVIAVSV